MSKKQLLLAHRGYSALAPENTHLAFEMAYQYKFDGVELDVHLTKDKKLVIIHDETTDRTAKTKKEIEFSNLDSLKEDDHSLFFKYKVQKQEILTLEEFLDEYIDKFTIINIEIKTDNKPYHGIEEQINLLSQKYGEIFFEKIVFSSFNFTTLENMKKLNNKYKLGFLFWTKKQFLQYSLEKITKICDFLNPWINFYDKNKEIVLKANLPLMLWTLRHEKKFLEYYKDENVYCQISNYKFEAPKEKH